MDSTQQKDKNIHYKHLYKSRHSILKQLKSKRENLKRNQGQVSFIGIKNSLIANF